MWWNWIDIRRLWIQYFIYFVFKFIAFWVQELHLFNCRCWFASMNFSNYCKKHIIILFVRKIFAKRNKNFRSDSHFHSQRLKCMAIEICLKKHCVCLSLCAAINNFEWDSFKFKMVIIISINSVVVVVVLLICVQWVFWSCNHVNG